MSCRAVLHGFGEFVAWTEEGFGRKARRGLRRRINERKGSAGVVVLVCHNVVGFYSHARATPVASGLTRLNALAILHR